MLYLLIRVYFDRFKRSTGSSSYHLKIEKMGKKRLLRMLFRQMVIIILFAGIQTISGQDNKDQTPPIPDDILKIFRNSCMYCHSKDGRILAKAKLDFSVWDEYGSAKGFAKASKICSELVEGAMPPKSYRASHPENIPTKEQIELICKWSDSLKPQEVVK